MHIVIAGAGGVGFHLAQLISIENHDIVLIDMSEDVLFYAATHLDVKTIKGDSASLSVLEKADVGKAEMVIAVTASEKNNILTASLAKKLGAKTTIARVRNEEYLEEEVQKSFGQMGVDKLISPINLAAKEISRLLERSWLTDTFDFEDGRISLMGITLDEDSCTIGKRLIDISEANKDISFRITAILRSNETILPGRNTVLYRNDHIYLFTKKEDLSKITEIFGKKDTSVNKVMIIGGTSLGLKTAQLLEKDYNVTLVEREKNTCGHLVEELHNTLVVKGDPGNMELLLEEGLKEMDAFIAVTDNTETNILSSLMAKKEDRIKTIALVENTNYIHISQKIGVDTIINKKLIAANNIFRYLRKGNVEALTTLHGVEAEVIEFEIRKENRVTKKTIRELHFPEEARIGGVVREGKAIIPTNDFQLKLHDKIIVFATPKAIRSIEKILR